MWIFLSNADEYNRFSSGVDHIKGSADLVVDSIKLSHDDSIDGSRIRVTDRKVNKGLIEFCELVDRVVPDESLPDEEHNIGCVDVDELRQGSHELFIALHSPCGINQNNIILLASGFVKCFFGDHGWIILVAFFVERDIQTSCVGRQLLDGATSEVVAACKHNLKVSFSL